MLTALRAALRHPDQQHRLGSRSRQTAMFVAAGSVPRSFQRSLMARSYVDQGIITGTTFVANYALATTAHDAIEGLARRVVQRAASSERGQRLSTSSLDLVALALGLGVQVAFRQRADERLGRGALRVAGWYAAAAGFGGVAVSALGEGLAQIDQRSGGRYNFQAMPIAIPAGAALSTIREFRRRRLPDTPGNQRNKNVSVSVTRSLLTGAGVAAGLAAVSGGERALAEAWERRLNAMFPRYRHAVAPLGHALSLGALVGVGYVGLRYVVGRVEQGEGVPYAGFDEPPTSASVSGGPDSLVSFDSLTRESRRHVLTWTREAWIEEVMDEAAKAKPIRIYVGLDSAPTVVDRVKLALAEIDRTNAIDRSLLVLVSPTGTGYVNYAAIEVAEYFARGDIATVTMQYSKRPSALSLDHIALGRMQNRMLWLAVHQRLYARAPETRPRVILFGESLGAQTSQDAFIHEGTLGLCVLGIDAALWLGTPYVSQWKEEVLGEPRPDVDPALVGTFDNAAQTEALDDEQRSQLRYVMLTHDNDPVAYFGVDLLLHAPAWLGPNRPPAVPPEQGWVPITTFLQTLIDMKNATNYEPGKFTRRGHDYRADLARFVRAVYRLDVSDAQLAHVEQALRKIERGWASWMEQHQASA